MIWFTIIPILISISISNVYTSISVGANVGGLTDWDGKLPYVNLIRQSRQWGSPGQPWDGNATFDPISGWPTSDFGVILADASLDLGGVYLLYAKGNAEISIDLDSSSRITNKTYDVSTNTLTALLNIKQGVPQLVISFRNTSGPGLQDIAVLQPGYNLTAKSDFTNLLLVHLSRFSILRFMDWTSTNGNPEVNWNDTTPVDWPQYTSKRNAWQTIPALANAVGKPIDIWINIPIGATDDYILHVARIMFSELNPTNNIYVEYSNEVWNYGFPQAHTNLHLANDSVLHQGDPYHFNYDNCSNVWYWALRRTAYQLTHIAQLFKTVFGEENVGQWKRVRPILAEQVGNAWSLILAVDYLNDIYGPPSTYIHGVAAAPYFNLGSYSTWSNLTTEQVLDAFSLNIQAMSPSQGWSQNEGLAVFATYAAWYKLLVHGYEGGADTANGCGACSLQAKINATRDPRMADICLTYLNAWHQFGFQELNWFTAGARLIGGSGSWGVLEDMRQETLIDTTKMFNATSPVAQLPRPAPKLKGIDQFRQGSVEFNFGIPIPSLNFNATNFMGHRVPYLNPDLRYLFPNSTFFYPIQIHQSPMKINLTVYVAGNSGILEAGINNEQFVQVQTPKTANMTTFQPAPIIQLNVNIPIVPGVATIRLRNIHNGYSIRGFDLVQS